MKILHTSDLHLTRDNNERWQALDILIQLGMKEKIDIFVIAGDLFDKGIEGEDLRSKMRSILSDKNFTTIIIPGNHDQDSFKESYFFGPKVEVILDLDKPVNIFENIRIWGLPFENIDEIEILERLNSIKHRLTDDKTNILLYHGQIIEKDFNRSDFGEEEEYRYMPMKYSHFANYNFKYILGGHIHTKSAIYKVKDCFFIYSGSPVSISKKENGRRKAILIEIGDDPKEIQLDTMHYEHLEIEINPIIDDTIEKIENKINEGLKLIPKTAKVILDLTGFFDSKTLQLEEEQVFEQLRNILDDKVEINFELIDRTLVFQSSLFKRFIEFLVSEEIADEEKETIQKYFIEATRGVPL